MPKELTATELIEGHALAIKSKWHNEDKIVLINVYTPNNRNDHLAFWERIDMERCFKGLRCPDIMLEDFNITKEQIDGALAHLDDVNGIAALRNL